MKIAIIGNAGSGKSTLALQLHQKLNIPVFHLDQYFWKPNWTPPEPQEYAVIHTMLCDQETWIIDGMNLRLLEYRIQKADVIIFLDVPLYVCFWRIFKRTWLYYGKETPTSAPGCPEKIDKHFIKFLKWVWDFKKRYPGKIHGILKSYANIKKIYILRSQKEIDFFLKNINELNYF